MPSVMEANGEIFWSKEVVCPYCGEEFESFDQSVSEGSYEMCDECFERDSEGEPLGTYHLQEPRASN